MHCTRSALDPTKDKEIPNKNLAWLELWNAVGDLNNLEKKLSTISENSRISYHRSPFHCLFAVSGPSIVEECCLYRWVLKISKETIFLPFKIQSFFLQEAWKRYQGYLCKLLWTGCLLVRGRCFTQFPGHKPEKNRRFCLLPLRLLLGLFKSLFFCL